MSTEFYHVAIDLFLLRWFPYMQSEDHSSAIQETLLKGSYVMLHVGTGPSHGTEQSASPLVVAEDRSRFDLSDDIWIEKLDVEFAKHIQMACEPPHYNIPSDPYDRHLYALVRRVPDVERSRYEGMEELFAVAALSRLVHPTSIGSRYCAWVFHHGLKDSSIQAIQFVGLSPDVILDQNNRRDWLSVEDGELLRKFMQWLPSGKSMRERVHRAYWYHEYAMRSYYLDARLQLVVAAFEALINTRDRANARQFRVRVGQLAAEFRIPLTEGELRRAFELRSKLVHGEKFLFGLESILPGSEQRVLCGKLESLLRMTIRTCLLDDTFAAHFHDRAAVDDRWPPPATPNSKIGN